MIEVTPTDTLRIIDGTTVLVVPVSEVLRLVVEESKERDECPRD